MRSFLKYVALTTVEETQIVTTGWVPNPPSVLIEDVEIPEEFYPNAAQYIQESMGPTNVTLVGKHWWQWRRPGSHVKAEWVEM